MPRETEIKLQIRDPQSLQRSLERLGALPVFPESPRVHEQNLLFDTPEGRLAKLGQLLRIRTETAAPMGESPSPDTPKRHILTYKCPPDSLATGSQAPYSLPGTHTPSGGRHKVREETELVISDAQALQKIFEGLGFRGWFRYEKYRTTYQLPTRFNWAQGLLIEIDETPIGTFVELEGPSSAIDQAAQELGFSPTDYLLKNYLMLYFDYCQKRGDQPTHMLFTPSH